MYIGLGVVLIVIGAILSFDVITVHMHYVNEHALGGILIAGGILAIVLSLVLTERYRRRTSYDAVPPTTVEERRVL